MSIQYIQTKKQCLTKIGNNVCTLCGKKLSALRTVDNSDQPTFWSGCIKCHRFNNGAPKKIYDIAFEINKKCNLDYTGESLSEMQKLCSIVFLSIELNKTK